MSEQAVMETAVKRQAQAGKYLTFMLAEESYGLEILTVREIIGVLPVTSVPKVPHFIKGVVNLRGKVIPVVDLRLKFEMDEIEHTEETCIIVVCVGNVEMGIIVDRVSEVLDIGEADIEPAPEFGANMEVEKNFILGMGKSDERVTILLDIREVLGDSANCPQIKQQQEQSSE